MEHGPGFIDVIGGVNPGQGSMDLDNLGVINFSIAFLYSIF